MCERFAGPVLLMLTFALQACLPKAASRGKCLGRTWDECGDDSSDGWAIHTWDALPSGSSEQHVQAVSDAQAASALGVEPPPGFSHPPPQLPLQALSHPGPEETTQQQPLPAYVPPPSGLGVVQAPQQQQQAVAAAPQQQQQQAVAAAPQQQQQAVAAAPLPQQQQAVAAAQPPQQQQAVAAAAAPLQHAAQGQPAQQGQIVEISGDYFLTNRPCMLRLRHLRQSSTLNFGDWAKDDPQQEAQLARQQQRPRLRGSLSGTGAMMASPKCGGMVSHLFLSFTGFSGPCAVWYNASTALLYIMPVHQLIKVPKTSFEFKIQKPHRSTDPNTDK